MVDLRVVGRRRCCCCLVFIFRPEIVDGETEGVVGVCFGTFELSQSSSQFSSQSRVDSARMADECWRQAMLSRESGRV